MNMAEVNIWQDLSPEEVLQFIQWALYNWKPKTPVNPVWHPLIRRTWSQMDTSFETSRKQILADTGESLFTSRMTENGMPSIMKIPWTVIEKMDISASRIIVNWQEFYLFNYDGNLLFTPEEVAAAHQRFIQYPKIERTFPAWILSESDIKGVADRFGLDLEGIDLDLVVHHFKKGFMPMVESWDEVLKIAIEQAKLEKFIQA